MMNCICSSVLKYVIYFLSELEIYNSTSKENETITTNKTPWGKCLSLKYVAIVSINKNATVLI